MSQFFEKLRRVVQSPNLVITSN